MIDLQLSAIEQLRVKSPDKFVYEQPVTPQRLIHEITASIPLNNTKSILVLFTVEWALYLRDIGFTNVIVAADNDPIIAKACLVFGLQYQDLAEIEKNKMKFDVVVGNPPYVANNAKIYQHFYNRAVNLLTNNGLIAFVAPFAISRGFIGKKVGDVKLSCQNLMVLNVNNIRDTYFPSVGIDNICYVIAGVNYTGHATVVTAEGQYVLDVNNLPLIPVKFNNNTLSIAEKCFDNNRNYFRRSNFHKKTSKENINGSTFVITKIDKDMSVCGYYIDAEVTAMTGKPRVFINTLGKRAIVDYTHSMVMKPNGSMICIETSSDLESENLVFLLQNNHKLIDFMCSFITGSSRSPYDTFLLNLKKLDLSMQWTPGMLYKYFGLTQKEIELIESTVK